MAMRHKNNTSGTRTPPDATLKRVFSFKEAVIRSPASSLSHTSRPLTKQQQSMQVSTSKATSHSKTNMEKKTRMTGPRTIRSRSITKIVESPSFKKRYETLKSQYSGLKQDHEKGQDVDLNQRSRTLTNAQYETLKQLTVQEEVGERELVLSSSNESLQQPAWSALSTSYLPCSSSEASLLSEKDDMPNKGDVESQLCAMSNEQMLLHRGTLSLRATLDCDTTGTLSIPSCSSNPVGVAEGSSLSQKQMGKNEDIRCVRSSTSQSRSPFVPVSSTLSTSFSSDRGLVCSDERDLSNDLAIGCSTGNQHQMRKGLESDDDFLDYDDTNSESTVESSCPSPRHSPLSYFGSQRHCDVTEMETCQEDGELLSTLSNCVDEDEEAYMLLERINNLSTDFVANREYEESNALTWSVQHAAQQGVISTQLQQNLFSNICEGHLDDARDMLYHKCHLVPAVGTVVESPMQPMMDPHALQSFVKFVDSISPTDPLEARVHKLHVLKQLADLLTKWVKVIGRERELSEEHIAFTKGSLFLAGSYRLGLDDPNSDIDAVCVTPWHVTHDDFFGSFCHLLGKTPGVSHLAPVPNAYVPLISLSLSGVRMDLLFARLPVSSVEPNQNIDSDHMLVGVNETSMKALNAPRVSSMLLCLVPRRREYRIVLRAVRAWARCRGIYSAKLGYLGGISWAILTAFVCQLYPNAEPTKIFLRFFQVLSEWQWPQPVMLNMIYDAGLGFDMWDPRQNVFDRSHIMPIITPAYPHMNSSVQISQSTFSVIFEELWRARHLAEIAVGLSKPFSMASVSSESSDADLKAAVICMATSMPSVNRPLDTVESTGGEAEAILDVDEGDTWDKLFETSNFFIRYSSYMVFNSKASSESAMYKWEKFVQSRLRKLVDNLCHISPVSRVHAFPRSFPHVCDPEHQGPGSCMFIGIEFYNRRHHTIHPKDDPEVKKTLEQTIRFFLATDLQQMEDKQPDMAADAKMVSWEELPDFVFPLGRRNADLDRAKYTADLEKMGCCQCNAPSNFSPYFVNSYNRNGKWRGDGPRKYTGGKWKRRDLRNSIPRSYSEIQTG